MLSDGHMSSFTLNISCIFEQQALHGDRKTPSDFAGFILIK